jgi:error-prone DNA polymerase
MALTLRRRPNDALRLHQLSNLAIRSHVPTVVTNDVLFHVPGRRILQDVVTCIRHNVTIDEAGFRRERHADRYLKPPEEMARLFSRYPEALARTIEIAQRCPFSLDELAYQYPDEATIPRPDAAASAGKAYLGGCSRTLSRGRARQCGRDHQARAAADRDSQIRAVFSDRECHRPLRPQPRHSVPGPRLGR